MVADETETAPSTGFEGRTLLVTGAASGIGLAVARRLAAAGATRLVLVDRDAAALARIELPATLDLMPGDVANEAFWTEVAPRLEGLSGAVINAGVSGAGVIAELDYAEWRRVLAVNLDGAFLTLRAAMRAITDGGTIVATASATGLKAEPGTAAYGASKAALLHLVKVAAKEGAPRRIRVNAIAPAGVETPMWEGMPFFDDLVARHGSRDGAFKAMAATATPLGRYATADEIAGQILFLLGPDSALVTGATLLSDGGYTL